MDNYYSLRSYVSNSNLSELQMAMGERPPIGGDKQKAYDFGNLIDALITEPDLVDHANRRVMVADGTWAYFDEATFKRAMKMKEDALKHDTMALLVRNMQFQAVVKEPRFMIESEYAHFGLPARIKMDGVNWGLSTGFDLKSTIAKTMKQFRDSLDFFEYDRQCAWYMDVAKLKNFWFAGVGKEPLRTGKHPVMFYAVERGDDFYKSGKAKYQRLAEYYHLGIVGLNPLLMAA